MRRLLLLGSAVLGACSTVPPTLRGVCRTSGTAQFIGHAASHETGAAILNATKATALRWASPGIMLTMDFRADRVTVRTGPDGKITAINCG